MLEKTYTWHKIAESIEELHLSPAGLAEVEVGGKKICIGLHNHSLHACAAKCPHAGGNMSQGYIDAVGNIVCPVHRYKFNLQQGRNSTGEGYFLKVYPMQQRPDGLFVGIEENNLTNWLK